MAVKRWIKINVCRIPCPRRHERHLRRQKLHSASALWHQQRGLGVASNQQVFALYSSCQCSTDCMTSFCTAVHSAMVMVAPLMILLASGAEVDKSYIC